jgi:choline dehydrogenase-like flavoprotein
MVGGRSDLVAHDPCGDQWDVIVIGTGMGGSTVGYELARRGRRVLFLEKGKFLHGDPAVARPPSTDHTEAQARMCEGHWPFPLEGRTSFGAVNFFAPMGCGSGGSTLLYGAQLERFAPADFQPRANFPNVRDANLPEQWPISCNEFTAFYRRAESLFRVRGTPDPLNPDPEASLRAPPPFSERDQALCESFVGLGLHPYRSHTGFEFIENCSECFNPCTRNCKNDAGRICLVPALSQHDARILPDCEVLNLLADRSRVKAIRARWNDREIMLHAKIVILSAGAFMTPMLLLNSRSSEWPEGLANRSGQVGRNLMLHASDLVAITQRELHSDAGPSKSMGLNDFYFDGGQKLGTFQKVGIPLVPGGILGYLRFVETRDPRWWRPWVSPFLPMASEIASRWFRKSVLFATIVEDLPYLENRVLADSNARNGMRFEYRYSGELLERNRHFRKRLAQTLSPRHPVRVVTGGTNNINYGHVCGTCRFGDNPATSALDASNRAHDVDNLYVVDASFFPSSGGTNPSLTIAANALRVGGIIDDRL